MEPIMTRRRQDKLIVPVFAFTAWISVFGFIMVHFG
jgi:hypothetical protein